MAGQTVLLMLTKARDIVILIYAVAFPLLLLAGRSRSFVLRRMLVYALTSGVGALCLVGIAGVVEATMSETPPVYPRNQFTRSIGLLAIAGFLALLLPRIWRALNQPSQSANESASGWFLRVCKQAGSELPKSFGFGKKA